MASRAKVTTRRVVNFLKKYFAMDPNRLSLSPTIKAASRGLSDSVLGVDHLDKGSFTFAEFEDHRAFNRIACIHIVNNT